MFQFSNPKWINQSLLGYSKLSEVPVEVLGQINARLNKVISANPLVSVVIPAYNEELNIIKCLDSLSQNDSSYPFEIVIVDNNSTDQTAAISKQMGVKYLFQPIQGCGAARQLGLERASGKYILTADADTIYPPNWVNKMMDALTSEGVVCACGRYSFLGDYTIPRWKLSFYEFLSESYAVIRGWKRPFLNAMGCSMGYPKDLALGIGYLHARMAGEDGRLAFDLMKYGKIKFVLSRDARVWTNSRTIALHGSLWQAFKVRLLMAVANFKSLFSRLGDHDTKNSPNATMDVQENLKAIKKGIGLGK